MSFCRITGRSRGLPKPHYFPIIKPMSPADAQRCCKVTGKSYGLPMHHYVPVLLKKTTVISKCRITKIADMYGRRKHYPLEGFKYVKPIIDEKNAKQKRLLDLLMSKAIGEDKNSQFVYTVKERRYSLVFPAQLELAVRDGDIKDVMLAKDDETVLLKMKQGEDISVPIQEMIEEEYMEEQELYEGEGVAQDVSTPKKQKFTANIAKIFEDKENEGIDDNVVMKKKIRKENKAAITVNTSDWRNLIEPLLMNCDWDQFEQQAANCMDIAKWTPDPSVIQKSTIPSQADKKITSPFQVIQDAVDKLTHTQLQQTENIFQKLIAGGKRVLESLPLVHEIQEIVKKLATGSATEVAGVPGMNVFTHQNRFIVGQTVDSKRGKIFVPGQTMYGDHFLPGFIVNTNDGPALIPGIIFSKQKHSSVFLPGQNLPTETGIFEFKPEQILISCKDLEPPKAVENEPKAESYEIRRNEKGEEYLEKCEEEIVVEEYVLLDNFVHDYQLQDHLNLEKAKHVAEKYHFSPENVSNLSKLLLTVTHFAQNGCNQARQGPEGSLVIEDKFSAPLKNALSKALDRLHDPTATEERIYDALAGVFDELEEKDEVVKGLCHLLNEPGRCDAIFDTLLEQINQEQWIVLNHLNQNNVDAAKQTAEKYKFSTESINNVANLLVAVTNFAQNTPETNHTASVPIPSEIKVVLKEAVAKAMDVLEQGSDGVYDALMEVFAGLENRDATVKDLCQFLTATGNCSPVFAEIINQIQQERHAVLNEFIASLQTQNNFNVDMAKTTAEKYHFSNVNNVTKLLVAVTHFAQTVLDKSANRTTCIADEAIQIDVDNKHCVLLKNALLTAVGVLNGENITAGTCHVYEALTEIFANLDNAEHVINDLCQYLNDTGNCERIFEKIIEHNNHQLPNVTKVDILKSALKISSNSNHMETIVDKLSTVIEEDMLAPAFRNISQNNPDFIRKVIGHLQTNSEDIVEDQKAYEILQVAIVNAIKETSEQKLTNFLTSEEKPAIKELLQEAIGLAVALGMTDTADSLYSVLNDTESTNILSEDPLTLEILKRLTLMRQIAEKQPTLYNALTELKRNPKGARSDPKLRELVRESAVLMVPDVARLKTSENIPSSLFYEQNTLAMEDFVSRNRQPGTLMIIKRGLQAVVPKEASRAVLNGQVAYTLIDETGIKHYQPLDVFAAMRLSKTTARRFSAYECLNAACEKQNRRQSESAEIKVKDLTNRLLACF